MASHALIAEGPILLDLEDDGVARLRLNRPESSNGMTAALLKALYEAVLRIQSDDRARCVLLSGEGKHFCAGGDVKDFASHGEALPLYLREATAWLQAASGALIRLPVPVVAVVQGFAAGGGGLGIVCAVDLVIAAESARFMSAATRVAMAPDAGTSVTLSRILGHRRAMELVLTDRVLDAHEALELGLVTRVVPDEQLGDEGLALARQLAGGATRALGATKRLMWDALGASVEDCLPDEARTVSELSGTADAREGLAAVIERRPPRFSGR
ncbi:MAG TPA: enoyl-CoA hydratase-related protein [Solirubrobacteraceae bacterium]|nr:enoyl-CoA hydratase-related protein [Solirubrobacteraceae bacterium]